MDDLFLGVDGILAIGDWRMNPALFSWAKRRRDIVGKTRSSVMDVSLSELVPVCSLVQSRVS